MKLHQLFFIILIAGLLSCQTKNNEVIISGKIEGDIPEKIEYSLPIYGVCSYAFKESVKPDSLGNFTIRVEIKEPSLFVSIFIPGKENATLLVEAGMNYNVNFDFGSEGINFEVLGDNQKGQEAYNGLLNPAHIQMGAREFLKDSIASDIKFKIKTLKDKEIALFDDLLSSGEISNVFYELVKLDREVYYGAVQGTVALIKKYEDIRLNNGVFSPEIKQMWEDSFVEISPTSIDIIRSNWYFSLAENYIMYNEYTSDAFDSNITRELYNDGLIHTHNIEQAKKYLTSHMLEYYTATYLYSESLQERYEKELISLFEEFKEDFPDSEFTQYLTPMISPVVAFHKKKEDTYNENIHFIDGYESLNYLSESVASLKGKKVYVDVWATWCGPCKKEFEHKTQLKELLSSYDVEVLYISIDDDQNDTQWKDMIKFYNLEGYHMRANKRLNEDLRKIFDKNGSLSIPWYLLIDENGNIEKVHASRPSQLNMLEKELN